MKIFALVLFALMYVLMIAKPKYRPFYALSVAVIFLIVGILPLNNLVSTINWNVLLMIAGTMIIVYYFIDSHMSNLLADILLGKSKNVMWEMFSAELTWSSNLSRNRSCRLLKTPASTEMRFSKSS